MSDAPSVDRLVSVVLPVYNQADHIAPIVEEHEAGLDRLEHPHETLLVVNGIRDASLDVCRRLESEHDAVRALHCEPGWGRAVKHGIAAARGEWICYTNSARTATEDLVRILGYALVNPRVVVKANRRIRESWVRRLGSVIYNFECRALFDLACWDVNGTPKVFPRAFGRLLALERDDDLIDLELHAVCRRLDYPILEVPIVAGRRHGGRSTTNLRSAVKMYWRAYRMAREDRRSREDRG